MKEATTRLCPFKRTEQGGFGLCSGAACMAYFEYQPYVSMKGCEAPPIIGMCSMMARFPSPDYCGINEERRKTP